MSDNNPQQPEKSQMRVAMIGASGIGKNHAAWFAANGARVCAFAGSSQESVARTAEVLAARLGYAPHGYCDIAELLEKEKPAAVCIASPPERHFDHAQQCLEAGVHVLCEKPLVYDASLSRAVLTDQARRLVELAARRDLLLGTQMQYSFIANTLCRLAGAEAADITSFEMVMETKNLKPGRSHETIWIELAPHPLSVLQKIAGACELDDEIHCAIGAQETRADFRLKRKSGKSIAARIVTRCNPETSTPLRRFTLNGATVDYAGRKNAAGDFRTYLSSGRHEEELPDLVDMLIGNFVAACTEREPLYVTGTDGACNVEWLLKILERGERQ
jgi:hypothetical protein